MTKIYLSGSDLVRVFPMAVRHDVLEAWATFPATRVLGTSFSVRVQNENLTIPYRLYNDPTLIHTESLTALQRNIVACLLTRHSSGFVREKHLAQIICLNYVWIPPFVMRLIGEYVIEILHFVHKSLPVLERSIYKDFLRDNSGFLALTEQRMVSYWDCYYRSQTREEYVGFKLMDFFQSLLRTDA